MINKDLWTKRAGYRNWILFIPKGESYISYLKWDEEEETALIDVDKDKFYILEGDWTDEYELASRQGYEACKKLFEMNKKNHMASSSDVDNVEETV